jgi:uncharacterized protein (TIGR02217 family)
LLLSTSEDEAMASFDDVRLPDDIEQGAVGGPNFQTTVIAMSSGNEQRNQDWAQSRCEWNVAYGIQEKVEYQALHAFFFARRGRSRGFRFKDWADFEFAENIGVGDDTVQDFQLVKNYELGGPHPYVRKLTRPVALALKIYFDDVLQTGGWSLTAGGIIHFATAPAAAVVVSAVGEYDVPVRFDTDKFDLNLTWIQAGAVPSLSVVELRE